MKLDHTALAVACSFAFASFAWGQASEFSTSTQRPSSKVQETHPAPAAKQTTPPDTTKMQQMPESSNPDAARTQKQAVRPDHAQPPATDTDMSTDTSALSDDDQDFLEDAIQGSYAEIEGSRLALEKTEDSKVRDFAQMMIDDHQKMVDEGTALARQKGMTPPDGPSVMQTTEVTALKALTGGAFDAMYVNRIGVAAHESTVDMFEQASKTVQDPDLQAMISKTLPKLREHLKMARTLNDQQDRQ